jgi:hypothetical protein
MTSELFIPIKFTTNIQLKPNEIGKNLEEILYSKLKNNLENMCSKHGYIKKNSIKIIKRSIGHIKIPHFNGNVCYDLQCIAEICNPAQGSIIKCKVKAKNSLGLLAEGFYDNIPILQIIVPKISAGIRSEINIDLVNIGDEINIEVCGKKFLLYDKYISIIGKAIKDKEQYIENVIDDINDDNEEEKQEDDIIDIVPLNINDDDINDVDEDKTDIVEEDDAEEDEEDEDDDLLEDEELSLEGGDIEDSEIFDEPYEDNFD